MQTAGMLRGTRAIYFLVLLTPLVVDHAHSYPYQLLPSIPGYIPVYIRNGDQPLEEINPALAEAFHEHSSLSKSIRFDRNLGHLESTDDGRTNSVIDESKKIYYPAHAREAGNAIANNERRQEEEETHVEESPGHQVPKLVSLYELHEKLKKKTQDSDGSRTSSVLKEINPILLVENLDKEEAKPNDLYDSNPNYPELPADIGHDRDTSQDFVSVIGLEALTEQPNVRQYKDLSHLTDERNAVDDKNEEKKEEEPVKVQRPSDILSNVQKLSPIAPPKAYAIEKSEEKSEIQTESKVENVPTLQPAVLYYKELSRLSSDQKVIESSDKKEEKSEEKEENSSDVAEDTVLKETTKEEPPSNVVKLSPIQPPEAYESQEKSTKDKIEEEKQVDASLIHEPILQSAVHFYKDLSGLSDDQGDTKMSSTATKEENEAPVKVESSLQVPANVVKFSPVAPPEAYAKKDQDATPSTILMQEIVQSKEKKDLTDRNDDVST
ncbi:hypothetical protein KPH14_009753 [Odynerus spinipes]|uniref:Uncharacterized protein n=1 Tax=Odynerus spinipes TaxID=1348599 RepID=A0AAD9RGK0_9HYME|nr:hypothetical protein KPH14_009753 [Odynerus spinipes]